MVALWAGAMILGFAAIGLLFLLDRDVDLGEVSREWLKKYGEPKGYGYKR